MMHDRYRIGLALCAGVVGLAALAPAAQAETSAADAAQCVADNDPAHVSGLLRTIPGSPSETKRAEPLLKLYGACASNRSATGQFSWRERAELAAAALGNKLTAQTTLAAANPAEWEAELKPTMVAGRDYDADALGLAQFGACVVRSVPQASLDLVRSKPGDAAESMAIGAMRPALASCMQSGQSLRLSAAQLRLVVAEPLYHALVR